MYKYICLNCGRLMSSLVNGGQCWGCYNSQIKPLYEKESNYVNEIICSEVEKTLVLLQNLYLKVDSLQSVFSKTLKRKLSSLIYELKLSIRKDYLHFSLLSAMEFFSEKSDIEILIKRNLCSDRLIYLDELLEILNKDRSIFSFSLKRKILKRLIELKAEAKGIKCSEPFIGV